MHTIKVIELMSNRQMSGEDAVRNAVDIAGKTLHNIRSVYIKDQSAVVSEGKITEYRVTVKVSFELDERKLLS